MSSVSSYAGTETVCIVSYFVISVGVTKTEGTLHGSKDVVSDARPLFQNFQNRSMHSAKRIEILPFVRYVERGSVCSCGSDAKNTMSVNRSLYPRRRYENALDRRRVVNVQLLCDDN